MSEHSMVAARASVMIYNDADKKWIAAGTSSGVSKVNIYHHSINNTFRVVGRKLQDMEVVVNCSIFKGLKYNQATPTFHQWRDNRQVYGLNFANKDEADSFAQAIYAALEALNVAAAASASPQSGANSSSSQPGAVTQPINLSTKPTVADQSDSATASNLVSSQNGHADVQPDRKMSRSHSREGLISHRRQSSYDNNIEESIDVAMSKSRMNEADNPVLTNTDDRQVIIASEVLKVQSSNVIPAAPPLPTGFQLPGRLHSLPAVAQHPGPPSPQPPPPPSQSSVPPPPPLPLINNSKPDVGANNPTIPPSPPSSPGHGTSTLASALKSAKLRKASGPDSNYASGSVTMGRPGSGNQPENMMSDLARILKERRAKAESVSSDVNDDGSMYSSCDSGQCTGTSVFTTPQSSLGLGKVAAESPRVDRSRRFQSLTGQETFHTLVPNVSNSRSGNSSDYDGLKRELLVEIKKEIQSAKLDIIEAIKLELNRR